MYEDHAVKMKTIARYLADKAFYSYASEPGGSYAVERQAAAILKKAMDHQLREDRHLTHHFLMEYLIFRLFLARYILKDYAQKYDGLLPIFGEFFRMECNLLNMVRSHAAAEDSLFGPLPDDWKRYTLFHIGKAYDRYEKIARKHEREEKDPRRAFLSAVRESLGAIREETDMALYPELFHFFMEESAGYADFLHKIYQQLLPEEIIIQQQPFLRSDLTRGTSGTYATAYRDLAYLTFALAGVVVMVLIQSGR